MEKLALELTSDGILFLSFEDIFIKEYSNAAATQILGNQVNQNDLSFLETFSKPDHFLSIAKRCLQDNTKVVESFDIRGCFPIQCTFAPANRKQLVVIVHLPRVDNLVQFIENIQGVSAGIVEYNPNMRYISISKTGLERLKRKKENVIGKYAGKDGLVALDVLEKLVRVVPTLNSKHQQAEIELTISTPTYDSPKQVLMTLQLLDKSTRYPIFFGYNLDITALREAEQRFEDKKKQLEEMDEPYRIIRKTFELSQFPIGTSELLAGEQDLKLILMNSAARKTMNVPPGSDLSSVNVWDLMPKPLITELLGRLKECYDCQHPIQYEVTVGETTLYLFPVEERKFSYFSLDISERKKLEVELKRHKDCLEELVLERTQKLEEALRVKGRFLATMSHELRTPIAGIAGAVNLLSETSLSAEQSELVEIANTATSQLLTVINDILDLTKLEANKMELEELEMSIIECVEKAVEVVSFEAEKKRIDILCDVDTSVPSHVIGDPNRLRQILINLLINAVKFSFKGSILVKVTSHKVPNTDSEEICFCVRDEGIGISEEARINLFQPFTQADSSTSRKYGGSGLGLSICKKLCERMGGRIWLESKLDEGTSFFFTVIARKGKIDTKEDFSDFNGKTALVIEESGLFKDTISSSLSRFMNCLTTSTLPEASEVLSKQKIDFVLIDGSFPKEAALQLHAHALVAVMGFSMELECWKQYPNIVGVRKPINLNKLLNLFRSSVFQPKQVLERNREIQMILLAEDNKLNQQIARKMLVSLGYEKIDIVENGRQAVEAASSGKYDIIFMDIMMPEMGGIEATELIRTLKIHQPVIIALTADVFVQQAKEDMQINCFDDVMLKPISRAKLGGFFEKYRATLSK